MARFGSVTGGGIVTDAASKADAAATRVVFRRGAARLVLVSAIAWAMLGLVALAFHLRPCSSPVTFLSGEPAS